jgi:hypothetical protein
LGVRLKDATHLLDRLAIYERQAEHDAAIAVGEHAIALADRAGRPDPEDPEEYSIHLGNCSMAHGRRGARPRRSTSWTVRWRPPGTASASDTKSTPAACEEAYGDPSCELSAALRDHAKVLKELENPE